VRPRRAAAARRGRRGEASLRRTHRASRRWGSRTGGAAGPRRDPPSRKPSLGHSMPAVVAGLLEARGGDVPPLRRAFTPRPVGAAAPSAPGSDGAAAHPSREENGCIVPVVRKDKLGPKLHVTFFLRTAGWF
jgi:hypothetical protein